MPSFDDDQKEADQLRCPVCLGDPDLSKQFYQRTTTLRPDGTIVHVRPGDGDDFPCWDQKDDFTQDDLDIAVWQRQQAEQALADAQQNLLYAADAAVFPEIRTPVQLMIAGLRELADFYEQHPEVKLPYEVESGRTLYIFGATKEQVQAGARAFGKAEKSFENDRFTLTKTFPSGLRLQFYVARELVCEKVVVGTQMVPAKVIPSSFTPEQFVEAHEEELVEYRCGSLLSPDALSEVAAVAIDSPIVSVPNSDDIPW